MRGAENLGAGLGPALRGGAASEGAGRWGAAAGSQAGNSPRGAQAPEVWKAQVGRRPAGKDARVAGAPGGAGGGAGQRRPEPSSEGQT